MMNIASARQHFSSVKWRLHLMMPLAIIGLAMLVGLTLAFDSRLIVLPVAVIFGLLLIQSAQFRFLFVLVGGLTTLQGSEGLNAQKGLYLVGAIVAIGFAATSLPTLSTSPWKHIVRPLLSVSAAWSMLVVLSFFVSSGSGVPVSDWGRDVVPYLLFVAVPILAHDLLSRSTTPSAMRSFVWFFGVCGILSALSFSVTWISRRDLADLPIDRLLLSSFMLPVAVYAYSLSRTFLGNGGRTKWAVAAGLVVLLFSVTATRSTIVLAVAPVAVVFSGRDRLLPNVGRLAIAAVALVVLSLILLRTVVPALGVDTAILEERLASTTEVFGDSTGAQSFDERSTQTALTREAFEAHPVLGVGPGYTYRWLTSTGKAKEAFVVDSPLSIPAKFGLLGTGVLLYTLVILWSLVVAIGKETDPSRVARGALVGFLSVATVQLGLGSPWEDKGFSFAVMLLVVLAGLSTVSPQPERSMQTSVARPTRFSSYGGEEAPTAGASR